MFRDSGSFNQDLTTWTLDSAANFRDMFFGSSRFNGEISGFVLSRVTVATRMFRDSGIKSKLLLPGSWEKLCWIYRRRNVPGRRLLWDASRPRPNSPIPGPLCFPCLATDEPTPQPNQAPPITSPIMSPTTSPITSPTTSFVDAFVNGAKCFDLLVDIFACEDRVPCGYSQRRTYVPTC